MDNLTENERVAADTAEAEKGQAAAALGKFKDVQTLMKAYSDLEAEFTRRCQRLKELEEGNKAKQLPDGAVASPSRKTEEERIADALKDEKLRDAVIGDYLKGLAENKVPLTSGGGAVTAPKNTPKSVKEAGKLAQQFLKG
ncbi:MAG: hypothetical protein K2N23_07625 [Clostridia bacterium]|nr:hypothetical protein [Clostridia bacterium]